MMTIGVIGAGTMGNGIAEAAAQVGKVILVDIDQGRAEEGRRTIEKRLNMLQLKTKFSVASLPQAISRI